ncbi:MAG TPA: peptidylprolyl isomerase [Pseudobdellovibrionaceae bacterium]|nr:peptidylprolyl isomerase [Pseudobdellovibrionaceae bacterium]
MKNFFSIFLLGGLIVSQNSWSAKETDVLATIGSKEITVKEFNKRFEEVRTQSINPPTKEQFLEDTVRYEIGVQEAEKKNVAKDPAVQERFRQELYKGLLEKELSAKIEKIKVTEEEMKAWYKENPEIRTRHILVELKPGATKEQRAEARKRAEEIYSEVKNSKRPFEELVRIYSDDPITKQTGGDVGWQSRLTLVPTFYSAILKTKIGSIAELVETQFGFHIIKVEDRRSYESANSRQIRMAVFDQKRKDIFDSYFSQLKKSYPVKTNTALLK